MNTKNNTPETTILSEVEKLIRLFSFYPEGHTYLTVASTRIYNVIKQQFGALNTAIYSVDRRNISIDNTVIEGFDKLSRLLFYKRIKTLILHNTIKLQELVVFVQSVSKGDLILPRDRSIKQVLFTGNISSIEVEEVDYDTIREELEKESEQQVETPEDSVELENVVQDLSDDEQEAIRLIGLIEKENNPSRYTDLSDALIAIIQRLTDIEKYEIPLIAIRTYTQHAYRKGGVQAITEVARKQVELISMEKGMIQQIITPITTGNPYYYDASVAMVKIVGEPAAKELADMMIGTETIQSLKFIARALSAFEKGAYHHLEKIMLSGNHRAATVAIDTAAAIKGAPEHAIAHALKNNDTRVKKKALQALFDLNTNTGNGIIDKLIVGSSEQRLTSLTISMIGKYRRAVFIPGIRHILSDQAVPYSIKHDALLVLGEIGGRDAVNVIIASIFGPGALLPKQYPDIKLAGIKALAMSMNEIALANLVKLLESRDARIRETAWNALYEIGKRINV
ncbi:MAG: HEAT repeat domain-containing protein [Deltaproteobacteria bacterium]|nr:HEAT repeat domain-containing protein [Deltaproteobacteria bacterium]MCL5276374.1 HEAT repeat domain-containing protein [Deltaproteobacteria bacterium]